MVIRNTARSGESHIRCERGLRELICAERVRQTPAPQAHPDVTERSPGLMLPWTRPSWAERNAVHFLTGARA